MSNPMVTILMATYNPNLVWLREQLVSINNQTYGNIELVLCDDCSTTIDEEQIDTILKQHITRFSYMFMRNETNQGTNETFERLTLIASQSCRRSQHSEESYLAFCDQDDIWEHHKIETLMNSIIQKSAVLAYSDMSIIDGEGNYVSDSITKVRKRFEYFEGNELWRKILVRNFISGCCMIIRTDIAKAAVPFEPGMKHDRWISVVASINGYIAYVDEPLVIYRQHGKNQTGVLKDITDKQTYIDVRLKDHLQMLQSIRTRTEENTEIRQFLDDYIEQVGTRCRYAEGKIPALFKMISYLKYNKPTILFEIIAFKMPNRLFKKIIQVIINKNL